MSLAFIAALVDFASAEAYQSNNRLLIHGYGCAVDP